MSDPTRPAVAKYEEPRDAAGLAHAFEVWMLDQFGLSASGGCGASGGDLDYALDLEDATILIGPSDKLFALKHGLAGDGRFVFLHPDEIELVDARRAGLADGPPTVVDRLSPGPN